MMRVAVFAPHPDDAEFGLGGVIALASQLGYKVTIISATGGELASSLDDIQQLQTRRQSEARRAAQVLQCDARFLELPDLKLENTPAMRVHFVRAIREVTPDIVFVNHPSDEHPDHRATAGLVKAACFQAMMHDETEGLFPWITSQLFCYETFSSISFRPDLYVDVTTTFERARAALAQHELGTKNVPFLFEKMRALHQLRGAECGVQFAEGLTLCHENPFRAILMRQVGLDFVSSLNRKN